MEVTYQQLPKAKKIPKDSPFLAGPIAASIVDKTKLFCNYSSNFTAVLTIYTGILTA